MHNRDRNAEAENPEAAPEGRSNDGEGRRGGDGEPGHVIRLWRNTVTSFIDAFKYAVMAFCVLGLLMTFFRVNTTPSVPVGLYLRLPYGSYEVGDYVLACLSGNAARLARERQYVPEAAPYRCNSGLVSVLKRVDAMGGDTVQVRKKGVFANGVRIAPAPPKKDRKGRALPVADTTYLLGPNEYWLSSVSYWGYDSRIYGPVDLLSLQGKAKPILTKPVPASLIRLPDTRLPPGIPNNSPSSHNSFLPN